MAFTQQTTKLPSSIGAIHITLIDRPAAGEDPQVQSARFLVHVLDQDGHEMNVVEGDLVPHLQPSDVTWLLDFVARMRAKAVDELLP